jgi:hypothetical protein
VALVVAIPGLGVSSSSGFVVRGWMVGEKKEDEASSVLAGWLLVALRLDLRVLALGLGSG